ncbi:Spy/CpxP family protein refolding chaperone [Geobacter sp. DSM 9736]|uniref:Spy/CpxP family protein refolding chaperone n=1 Tax=Geobacter sp. DSM 9736 TaxID=1277350 RepID=UPI000B50CA6F|nr:hypothetical protein [Geobacter sp. DSM 9736]
MKRICSHLILLLAAFCVCSVSPSFAREGKKGEYNPKESFEDFSRKLNLTKEQKEKVRPVLNEQADRIREVYREAREKETRILEENQQKVMEVLNPQQKEKYQKMIEKRKKMQEKADVDVPIVVTVVVAEPVTYYGKSVVADGYVKRVLTKNAFILSEAPEGVAEIVVVGAGPAVVKNPQKGQKVKVRGVFQNFKIDEIQKQLKVDLDEGIFGQLENKPGIFARWVKKQ